MLLLLFNVNVYIKGFNEELENQVESKEKRKFLGWFSLEICVFSSLIGGLQLNN